MKLRVNPLDNVKVAAPCLAEWEQMIGNDQIRFCAQCKLNVYNLSGMTRTQAERLIVQTEGRLCVRFYRRADGTILTRNCPVGLRTLKQKLQRTASALASLVLSFFAGLFAFAGWQKFPSVPGYFSPTELEMGDMVVVAPERRPRAAVIETKGRVAAPEPVIGTTGVLALAPEFTATKKQTKKRRRSIR